ncbi:bacillithiol biosynthesis cysteine-adding enzyme BshC [Mangrovimonas spongiae]|uniref:Putative cysteine ligase BshC n=1 Tax=Mangrovimonas spongiae TaxID=2494697 RepID=A0A3R9NS67_9FLAO|nr:bacillithiol biosynthesis cysteine-adding enzyme BshC [Mangrovimonas spongiae]RSK40555.1 bacillithiol biosynthesis cysteine-adding enzyme BshC [Mangrovimonas spongiae]
MPADCIPFKDTNYFSKLICDYLEEKKELKVFYGEYPSIPNFKKQIELKKSNYDNHTRRVLVSTIKNQYANIDISAKTETNIKLLEDEKTFTVTTGHQLNLFTGPLYFLYKIISTINLCKELKNNYPDYNFVPIYWMATEDHDFDEINYFNFEGKKIQWNRESSGAVGKLNLDGLDDVFNVFSNQLNKSNNAKYILDVFEKAYLNHDNLTQATRFLANSLFKEYGLVIVDGDDRDLKQLFVPFVKDELLHQKAFKEVNQTSDALNKLSEDYKIQVTPREINLFYIKDHIRERIVEVDGEYAVLETAIRWTKEALLKEVESYPERFSPNVILRPLYQEAILPNLCYIGGGGELAYWLQLKSNFETQNVVFPMLLLRNSALLITGKQEEKLKKLNISIEDLFLKQSDLITKVTKQVSKIDIDFSAQKKHLEQQFKALYKLAEQTDKSFLGAVGAQERKQIKGLEHLEKRLLKAQKRKLSDILNRVEVIQNELFPNQSLQERQVNFSEFYLEYGDQLIQQLVLNLQPLKSEFLILKLE